MAALATRPSSARCTWPGIISTKLLQMPIKGFLKSSGPFTCPVAYKRERCGARSKPSFTMLLPITDSPVLVVTIQTGGTLPNSFRGMLQYNRLPPKHCNSRCISASGVSSAENIPWGENPCVGFPGRNIRLIPEGISSACRETRETARAREKPGQPQSSEPLPNHLSERPDF
ncbi:MAG: hypothetical protein BWX80_02968 [Candidatus Hydrogenedentes bacterium ADurb.Bin101]|nr:MAG: hypothetical protein BWX80_02968 [Candidatus Hydrogenedentes bacterium ADurb.Bin101]